MRDEKSKLVELMSILYSSKRRPRHLRAFFINKTEWIRIYDGLGSGGFFAEEMGIVRTVKLDRGDILELFSRLEFFANEILRLQLLPPISEKTLLLDDVFACVDFFNRVKLLYKWGIIDGKLKESIRLVTEVRNSFAHKWDENEIFYKNKNIRNNFREFKKDTEEVFAKLIETYQKEQQKIDIDEIINEIKKHNTQ